MNELAAIDAIFTLDTGVVTVWAARYLRMEKDRRMIGSWNHGSMANALPQAIGAQLAYPGRQVISLSGDGGFSMLMGDVLTIKQHRLQFKTVVYNNGTLGMVKREMEVNPYELSMPPKLALSQVWGYSLYMLKEVLGGRGSEPLELVESNLRK